MNKEKTNTKSYAQRELDILIKTTPDAIIRHSGFANAFFKANP